MSKDWKALLARRSKETAHGKINFIYRRSKEAMKRRYVIALTLMACLLLGAGLASAQCVPSVTNLTGGYGHTGPGLVVGTVTVWNDVTNLYVRYDTTGGWVLTETHLGICSSEFTSRPIPGHSPYMKENQNTTSYLYTIPLAAIKLHPDCGDCTSPPCTIDATCAAVPAGQPLFIAAHAAVRNSSPPPGYEASQTAYGGTCYGSEGQSWFCQIDYTICCTGAPPPPPPSACDETAWGKAITPDPSTCLLNITNLNANKWGWTNGPLGAGNYTFELWAAAGQCLTANGTLVGTVTVSYAGSSATVTYTVTGNNPDTGAPYKLDEVHLWVGSTPLPMMPKKVKKVVTYVPTAAPGLFPYLPVIAPGGLSATYTVTGLSGSIYVAAHAKVNGFPCPPPPVTAP
jgi:hypothetical protein